MTPQQMAKLIAGAVLLFVLVILVSASTYVVDPGYRGVAVTLGKVSPHPRPEGFGWKLPFVTTIVQQTIRQQMVKMQADCYSSDLQQVKMDMRVLFHVPPQSVVSLYRDYQGDPFESLIKPRVAEAVKEITALRTAELIVQNREEIKATVLTKARNKVGSLLVIEDVVIEDIQLTDELESAIEQKMVQEQEAARARFRQEQTKIEAQTLVVKARGEAEAINLRGEALRQNPSILELEAVERWDGITPLVIGPGVEGANLILPLGLKPASLPTAHAPSPSQPQPKEAP